MSASHIAKLTAAVDWAGGVLADKDQRHALCDTVFAADDADGSGTLELGEMKTLVLKVVNKYELPMPREAKVEELYQLCDKNGDGTLTNDEFRDALARLVPVPMDDRSMDSLVQQLDTDGDGTISIEEWIAFLQARFTCALTGDD